MAKQTINIGTVAGDGTGTTLRNSFDMVNDNFTELYDNVSFANNSTTTALSAATLDSTYSSAQQGFRVFALDIIAGALIYTKTVSGWISTITTIVV